MHTTVCKILYYVCSWSYVKECPNNFLNKTITFFLITKAAYTQGQKFRETKENHLQSYPILPLRVVNVFSVCHFSKLTHWENSLVNQRLELSTFTAETTDLTPHWGTKIFARVAVLQSLPQNQTHWWKHSWQQILDRMWRNWIIHMSFLGIQSGTATLENTLAVHCKTKSELNIQQ